MKHANLKALFTAIANSIRNKTGGTDAIIADDFPEAIDGIQTGGGVDKIQRWIELSNGSASQLFVGFKGSSVDELMDGVDTSNVTDTTRMFDGCVVLKSVPLFDTSRVELMEYMFNNCSNLTAMPLFDTGNATAVAYMFTRCLKLTEIPLFNVRMAKSINYTFSNCHQLTTIPALDIRSVTNAAYAFDYCIALTECWVRNIKTNLQVGKGTTWGHLLTLESLLHLCKECRKTTSSLKLTVGTANLAKLEGIYVKLIDITDDMRAEDDLIDEKYPFVQCESTDEGAMTLQDYMATKMWSLA